MDLGFTARVAGLYETLSPEGQFKGIWKAVTLGPYILKRNSSLQLQTGRGRSSSLENNVHLFVDWQA